MSILTDDEPPPVFGTDDEPPLVFGTPPVFGTPTEVTTHDGHAFREGERLFVDMIFALEFDKDVYRNTSAFPVMVDMKIVCTSAVLRVRSAFREGEPNILWVEGENFNERVRVQRVQTRIGFDPPLYFPLDNVSRKGDVYTTKKATESGFTLPGFKFEFSSGKFKLNADFKLDLEVPYERKAAPRPRDDEIVRDITEINYDIDHPWISYKEFTESQGKRHPKAPHPRV